MAFRLLLPVILMLAASLFHSCNPKRIAVPHGFQLEPGFALTLVASEPLIKDPVDLEFNAEGDAYVLEMPGYPFEDTQSRIIVLKDKNQDGIYDEPILFADNLQLASSIMLYKKGVLVAAPPYLLYVMDNDGDFKADAVDTLMGGFSTGNLQHNYNGLAYGLDNWIYAVNGGNSGKPYWWGDPESVMNLRGQDFRFNLESKVMERIGESSGGFGLGMDEWGHLYETHNLEHISHLVFPDRYQNGVRLMRAHSLSNISDHEENGLARIYPIGEQESRVNHPEQSGYFSGSCGVTYYGGGAFGAEYENTVWVADVVLNLIHVDKLTSNGASFSAERVFEKKDFLASADRSFRPVNMSVGPDGSMYVVDMYRQVIEHPEWIPDEIEAKLNLNSGKDKGRIYRIRKADAKETDFKADQFKTMEGIISSLSHPNQWMRKTAHRLLMERSLSDLEINEITKLLNSTSTLARLHALWILHAKDQLTADQLLTALEDTAAGIRENGLIMSEKYINTNETLLRKCLALLEDENQRVRMQAALTLSTLGEEKFNLYKKDLLIALAQAATKPIDNWNIAAITLAAQQESSTLFSQLSAAKSTSSHQVKLLESLARVSAYSIPPISSLLSSLATSELSNEHKRFIINQITEGVHSNLNGSITLASLRQLEKKDDIELVAALTSLRRKLSLPPSPEFLTFSKNALVKLSDRSLPDSIRIEQMSVIALLPYSDKSEQLFQCLDNTQPLQLQEAALRQLADASEPTIGTKLVNRWKELGPQVRRWASDLLLYKEMYHDALLTGLENGIINIGEMNFDLERRRQLLWWTDDETTKRRAAALFSDAGVTTRKEAIDKMKEALTLTGSSANGANVFQSICSNCHKYGAVGQEVGPVLTEINRKSKEALMHDILDPNAAVDTKYINHRLATKAGDVHVGIVDNETDQFITIKKTGGTNVTIYKTDIKSFTSMGTSMMTEGLEASMTTQELADLLTFLQNGNE